MRQGPIGGGQTALELNQAWREGQEQRGAGPGVKKRGFDGLKKVPGVAGCWPTRQTTVQQDPAKGGREVRSRDRSPEQTLIPRPEASSNFVTANLGFSVPGFGRLEIEQPFAVPKMREHDSGGASQDHSSLYRTWSNDHPVAHPPGIAALDREVDVGADWKPIGACPVEQATDVAQRKFTVVEQRSQEPAVHVGVVFTSFAR
jgi:hypothetical protein